MSIRHHFLFWGLSFLALLSFIYVFKSVLLPFILGLAVAYLLNPLVGVFGKLKIARAPAALIILGGFVLFLVAVLAAITPILYRQLLQLAADMPGYIDRLFELVEPLSQRAFEVLGQEGDVDLRAALGAHAGSALDVAAQFLGRLIDGGQAALDMISVMVFTPIVAYYIMKEWAHVTGWAEGMLPKDNKVTIMNILKQIDQKISGFVRGQISVAVILGVVYAVALTIAGLKYGFLIGLTAGLLSIIPMVGSAIGLVVSVAVAWFQSGELTYMAIIAGIFLVGQLIEGNFLTPKLVGDSVGLHPLWVFFALLAGGSLFGILGMLIAVPVAAIAGVLLAFAITQYKKSVYFLGQKAKKVGSASKKKKS